MLKIFKTYPKLLLQLPARQAVAQPDSNNNPVNGHIEVDKTHIWFLKDMVPLKTFIPYASNF